MAINLIPPKLKEERKISQIISQFLNFAFAYFILFCILTGVLFFANIYIKSSIDKANDQITQENVKLNKFKDIEIELKSANGKLANIKAVDSNRLMWSNILVELSKCTPTQTQIKSIVGDGTKLNLTLTGYATNRTAIANLKDKMEASKYFKNVNFTTSSYDDRNQNYTFNLTAELEQIK